VSVSLFEREDRSDLFKLPDPINRPEWTGFRLDVSPRNTAIANVYEEIYLIERPMITRKPAALFTVSSLAVRRSECFPRAQKSSEQGESRR
jgi:hypothetical protein